MFKITDKDIFEDNPALKAIPEFADKPSRSLKYVFLVYDFASPFKNMPINKRKEAVARDVGYKMERDKNGIETRFDKNAREVLAGQNKAIEEIRVKFESLQDNRELRLAASINAQIDEWIDMMNNPAKDDKERDFIFKVMDKIDSFLLKRKKVLEILNLAEKEKESSGQPMSLLDQLNEG